MKENVVNKEIDFDKICESVNDNMFSSYKFAFINESKKDIYGEKQVATLVLISKAFCMSIDLESKNTHFQPSFCVPSSGRRGVTYTDLTEDELCELENIAKKSTNIFITARVNDILWWRKRNYQSALSAIDAMISIGMTYSKHENKYWTEGVISIRRAVQLWKSIGSKKEFIVKFEKYFDTFINFKEKEYNDYYRVMLLEAMIDCSFTKNSPDFFNSILTLALDCQSKYKDYEKSEKYLEILLSIGKGFKNEEIIKKSESGLLDNSLQHLEHEKSIGASSMRLSMLYTKAIEVHKRFGNKREKIDELHLELNAIRKESLRELKPISTKINIKLDLYNKVKEEIRNCKSLKEAFETLIMIANPIDFSESELKAKENIQSTPLTHSLSSYSLDDKGRLIAVHGSAFSDNPKHREAAILAQMIRNETLRQTLHGMESIDGAREAILEKFGNEIIPWIDNLISYNPFVPMDRYQLFRTGLISGLNGDWVSCAHILIPQIENSIRNTFEESGKLVSIFKQDQTQVELDLNTLLYCPESEEVLGKNLRFMLRVSLTEKLGLGLRNSFAHGRLPDDFFNSSKIGFFWCIALYLLFISKMSVQPNNE